VLDSGLKTPPSAKLFKNAKGKVWLVASDRTPESRDRRYAGLAEVLRVRETKGRLDLKTFLANIGREGIVSVLIEGGGEVIAHAFKEKLVQEFHCVIAPKIIGGRNAVSSVAGEGVALVKKAVKMKDLEVEFVDGDIWMKGSPRYV
jgi:diaminohydroxyphosphoribosylaminopyrimidine deaminase/5-amino-6-(5-phosphoribosylamino)uracil reductase